MLENIILVNLAICLIFGIILVNRKYDLRVVYGNESRSFALALLLVLSVIVNVMPIASAEDSDGDGVDDEIDECPDNETGENITVAANGCSYPSYLDDVWMCIDGGIMVQDLSGNDEEECSVTISSDGTYMMISTPAIANHDMEGGVAGNIVPQDFEWKLPLSPTNNTDCNPELSIEGCEIAPNRGPVAVAVNGVPFYGPEDGPGGDAVAHEIGIYEEDRQEIALGICGAHTGPSGYHYHFDGNCMHWHDDDGGDFDYEFSKVDSSAHSPIIGFAFDGYPIYGSYGEVGGEITLIRSNYILKEDSGMGYNGIDDYEYSADNGGHLDACNGRFSATPEFPDGIYHYYSTMPVTGENPDANNAFPYFINCYRGVAETSNADGGALDGGGGGTQTGPPDDDADHVGNGWDLCDDTGDTTYPDGNPIYPRGCTEEQFSALSAEDQDIAKVAYAGDDPPAPPDDDGDGIPDPLDDCPDTETGSLVYSDGCAHEVTEEEENEETENNETAVDTDGDGVPDEDDNCPEEDASGHDANADGCIDDSDNDGVKNDVDVCPFDATDACLVNLEGNNNTFIEGCTDTKAENYNSDALEDDGTCSYEIDMEGGFTTGEVTFMGALIFATGGIAYYLVRIRPELIETEIWNDDDE